MTTEFFCQETIGLCSRVGGSLKTYDTLVKEVVRMAVCILCKSITIIKQPFYFTSGTRT